MVSAILGGVSLRVATRWEESRPNLAISTTTSDTKITCWDTSLGRPGAVEIAKTELRLRGGPGADYNHAKVGVSISGDPLRANDGETSESLKFSLEGEGQPSWSCITKG
jgi:hypothetical protein